MIDVPHSMSHGPPYLQTQTLGVAEDTGQSTLCRLHGGENPAPAASGFICFIISCKVVGYRRGARYTFLKDTVYGFTLQATTTYFTSEQYFSRGVSLVKSTGL